jgi:hypothetical protein
MGYEGFEDPVEIAEFVLGVGHHSDKNSFLVDSQDFRMWAAEGYMRPVYCHLYVEEILESDPEENINPEIEPNGYTQSEDSFLSGADKVSHHTRYLCKRHPSTYLELITTDFIEK